MGCLHDPANVQQTSSKCIQNTRANAGRLLDRVNTLLLRTAAHIRKASFNFRCELPTVLKTMSDSTVSVSDGNNVLMRPIYVDADRLVRHLF